jgi:hypothetical protein
LHEQGAELLTGGLLRERRTSGAHRWAAPFVNAVVVQRLLAESGMESMTCGWLSLVVVVGLVANLLLAVVGRCGDLARHRLVRCQGSSRGVERRGLLQPRVRTTVIRLNPVCHGRPVSELHAHAAIDIASVKRHPSIDRPPAIHAARWTEPWTPICLLDVTEVLAVDEQARVAEPLLD